MECPDVSADPFALLLNAFGSFAKDETEINGVANCELQLSSLLTVVAGMASLITARRNLSAC